MLEMDPKERVTAAEALKHPLIKDLEVKKVEFCLDLTVDEKLMDQNNTITDEKSMEEVLKYDKEKINDERPIPVLIAKRDRVKSLEITDDDIMKNSKGIVEGEMNSELLCKEGEMNS